MPNADATHTVLAVAIDVPLQQVFHYRWEGLGNAPAPGCRVRVPFGRTQRVGLVWPDAPPAPDLPLKPVTEAIDAVPLLGPQDLALLSFATRYYRHPPGEVVAAALPQVLRQASEHRLAEERWRVTESATEAPESLVRRAPQQARLLSLLLAHQEGLSAATLTAQWPQWRPVARRMEARGWLACEHVNVKFAGSTASAPEKPLTLNAEQQGAVDAVAASLLGAADTPNTWLLDGVTGSGKTEVYLHLLQRVLEAGQQALILVPEIGLTPQLAGRIERRFGLSVALLHSNMSDGARAAHWLACQRGEAQIVLGTRSAVFVPLPRLGLVIVDEEHDPSLKQHEGFRYQARDLAVWRARQAGVTCVLGSATPALESLLNVRRGRYGHAVLSTRAGTARPPVVRVVDLQRWHADDGLSAPALDAMRSHLAAGQQVLVFLNRRGFAPTIVCRDCGQMAECRQCDARLTYHASDHSLRCHHCGAYEPMRERCTACGGELALVGTGTERVDDALSQHFPDYPVLRIDRDTTQGRGALPQALAQAHDGTARILVGTQMLAKGHHLPKVTLVVIVNADQGFFASDFRGSERLAQTLVQVAGRAGRAESPGEVMIQSAFPEHPLLLTLLQSGYSGFAKRVLDEREATGWPPFTHIALLHAAARDGGQAQRFLADTAQWLVSMGVSPLGPVPARMLRRRGQYRYQLLLQADTRNAVQRALAALTEYLAAHPPPSTLRWSLDVDPLGVL
ncbi:MAG: primosomal protein N' [Pseudomonadota bacterium]